MTPQPPPQLPTTLQRYGADVERPADDEAETIRELIETMTTISETTLRHGGHPLRSVHAKSHGLIDAELTIAAGLPTSLAQGLFARPGTHMAVMRFSTSPGDLLPDSVSTPRGVAIKVMDVPGERLTPDGTASQDFVMVNGPAFLVPTPKKFLGNIKLLAKTTDRAEGLKRLLSSALQATEHVIEALGGESGTIKSLGGHPETHPLGETYFTQVPLRFGEYIAKLSLVPETPELIALKGAKVDVETDPDGLRHAISTYFAREGAMWSLRAQLCTDLETMPVEDASVVWPQDRSPYLEVATLRAKAQPSWNDEKVARINEAMAFSPWHGIAAHQPLGGIMRARRQTYEAGVKFRAQHGVHAAA